MMKCQRNFADFSNPENFQLHRPAPDASPSERTSSPEGVGEVDHGRHGDRQLRAGEVEAVAREEVQGPAEERDLNK